MFRTWKRTPAASKTGHGNYFEEAYPNVCGDVAHAADRDHERIPQRKGPQKPLDELLPALRAARKHDAFAQPVEVRPVELEDLPSRVGDLLLDPGDLGRVGGAARCV